MRNVGFLVPLRGRPEPAYFLALGEVTQPLLARGAGKPASGVSVLRRKQRSAPGIGSDSGMGSLSVVPAGLAFCRHRGLRTSTGKATSVELSVLGLLCLAPYVDTIM